VPERPRALALHARELGDDRGVRVAPRRARKSRESCTSAAKRSTGFASPRRGWRSGVRRCVDAPSADAPAFGKDAALDQVRVEVVVDAAQLRLGMVLELVQQRQPAP
jgi:hypothetical protein